MPHGELDTEEKHDFVSAGDSSEDEEEADKISRTRSPPKSPSINLSPEVENVEEKAPVLDEQPTLHAESSSEDETDEHEAVNETIKMSSPPGSPEPEIYPTSEDGTRSSQRKTRRDRCRHR